MTDKLFAKPILYLEFGVWKGDSMRWFSQAYVHPESRFLGFDTFTGLPEDWQFVPKGSFSAEGSLPNINDTRVTFFKGLFSETLPNVMEEIHTLARTRTVIVHVDADLFSSTLFVLTRLWPREVYALFDEFFGEEALAVQAFTKAYPCRVDVMAMDDRQKPNRVFGLMTAVK
jgi:O-methyltransferase